MSLYLTFQAAKMGDEESVLFLYNKFLPKIKKCSRRLNYETAESDIIIRFLEFIKNTNFEALNSKCDGAIVNYTNKFFDNTYVNLLCAKKPQMQFIYLNDENNFTQDVPYYDDQSYLEMNCFSYLTELQKKIIVYRYIYGYSVQEIAQKLNVSRQAVNRAKNRGIKIIKSVYDEHSQS